MELLNNVNGSDAPKPGARPSTEARMGQFERTMLMRRANAEGRDAFLGGKTEEECPYKVSDWGAGGFWLSGFNSARNEAGRKALEASDAV